MSAKLHLDNFTDEQLSEEVERRRRRKERAAAAGPPAAAGRPDWSPLVDFLKQEIENISTEGGHLKDSDHYVYEVAMECLYGRAIWKWMNQRLTR